MAKQAVKAKRAVRGSRTGRPIMALLSGEREPLSVHESGMDNRCPAVEDREKVRLYVMAFLGRHMLAGVEV